MPRETMLKLWSVYPKQFAVNTQLHGLRAGKLFYSKLQKLLNIISPSEIITILTNTYEDN